MPTVPTGAVPPTPTARANNVARSPRYPQLSYPQAAERAQRIYEKESTHSVPAEIAVQALGYTTLNGTSKNVLSALRKFGLLDADGKDGYKISNDAVTVFELDPEDPERVGAVRRLALRPSIFKMIREKYGPKLPSDGAMRHFLIQNGYQSDGANQVIKFYKETMDYLSRLGPDTLNEEEDEVPPPSESPRSQLDQQKSGRPPAVVASVPEAAMSNSKPHFRFGVAAECYAEVTFTGEVTEARIEKLIQFLELSKDNYSIKADKPPARNGHATTAPTSPSLFDAADVADGGLDDDELDDDLDDDLEDE